MIISIILFSGCVSVLTMVVLARWPIRQPPAPQFFPLSFPSLFLLLIRTPQFDLAILISSPFSTDAHLDTQTNRRSRTRTSRLAHGLLLSPTSAARSFLSESLSINRNSCSIHPISNVRSIDPWCLGAYARAPGLWGLVAWSAPSDHRLHDG